MTHVFVSPHPDDAPLSCGGLIAELRARRERVAIVTIFSGSGDLDRVTPYQRLALGFGNHEKSRPGDDALDPDDRAGAGQSASERHVEALAPAAVMAVRRAEDEAYARFAGASLALIDLPDAVFRGYEGDAQPFAAPRENDRPPIEALRAALARLRPATLYVPLAIGGHVDHRQAHRAAVALLSEPGSPYLERALFYEDFPYALALEFERLDKLDPELVRSLPAGVTLEPVYVHVGHRMDEKIDGLRTYESQLGRLFGGAGAMEADVREPAARLERIGGTGPSERCWRIATS